MKNSLDVLFLPLHRSVSFRYGSENALAMNFLKAALRLSPNTLAITGSSEIKDEELKSHVIDLHISPDRTPLNDFKFYLKLLIIKLTLKSKVVHHLLPLGFKSGFNLAFLTPKFGSIYVIGPLLYPLVEDEPDLLVKLGYVKKFTNYNNNLLLRKTLNILNKLTLLRADFLIFDSEETRNLYLSYLPNLSNKKYAIIPGVVSDIFFKPRQEVFDRQFVKFGIASNLIPRKRIDVAIKAMAISKVKNASLFIVGKGPEEAKLRKLVKELKLEDRIKFLGWLNSEDIPNFYHEMDVIIALDPTPVFIAPSREEALASSCAIIAGNKSVRIKQLPYGYLVNSDDPSTVAEAITLLSQDIDLLTSMQKEGRKVAENVLSESAVAAKLKEIYFSL